MPTPLDPGHAARKQKLGAIFKLTLFAGIVLLVSGATSFTTSAVLGPERLHLASALGIVGFFLLAAGLVVTFMIAAPLFLFLQVGAALRYQAEEMVPLAEDLARRRADLQDKLAPRAAKLQRRVAPDLATAGEKIARSVARGARQGWSDEKK